MKFLTQDYYEILNVAPGASNEEVKRAYRTVRKSFRPDSMAIHSLYSAEETEAISAKMDEAFQILSDPESSRRYDKYRRGGAAGQNIPRDPDQFFDLVHDLDGSSPIEELANQLAGARTERLATVASIHPPVEAPVHAPAAAPPQAQLPLKLTQRTDELAPAAVEAVAQAEVFIDSLEILPIPDQPPAVAPVQAMRTVATTPVDAPPVIRTPSGIHLGPRTVEPSVEPRARVDFTARPLPGAAVEPPTSQATTLATPPVAAAPKVPDVPQRSWLRDTIRTRAVGAFEIDPLPREELDALEMDCGGVSGEYLRQVRRGCGVALEDIADRTKIGLGMLRAIEADEVDRLPARVYLKGYLSQMCRLLRLPVPQVPERYLNRHGL